MEIFDIYDEQMNPIGTASRAEVHKLGHWHQTFHCWLIRRDGSRRYVWFQLRQAGKDTYPDHYDITAAGHLSAGETVREAVREIEEELGLSADFEQLVPLGQYREESASEAGGVPFIDRELSHVFGLVCKVPLVSLKLQAEEVAGVYEAELEDMIALFEGRISEVGAQGVEPAADGQLQLAQRTVTASRFVPRESSYYAGIFRSLAQLG
ncbi:NUDIX hydrolase [Paenibacillus abyssi]|uniref:Nudix hydrolase n=1 Tax=Paenibacillus abyssi TaxID=1340531 RepID=A0A917G594_9BACL|nr:NUDIX domain-containing protein [Paenibacillus abyssi]GGG23630.1 putative Nudix hydrolase [Paenibacillus abyssi]